MACSEPFESAVTITLNLLCTRVKTLLKGGPCRSQSLLLPSLPWLHVRGTGDVPQASGHQPPAKGPCSQCRRHWREMDGAFKVGPRRAQEHTLICREHQGPSGRRAHDRVTLLCPREGGDPQIPT